MIYFLQMYLHFLTLCDSHGNETYDSLFAIKLPHKHMNASYILVFLRNAKKKKEETQEIQIQ